MERTPGTAIRMRMSMKISSCTVTVATTSPNSTSADASLANTARVSSPRGSIVVDCPAMLSRMLSPMLIRAPTSRSRKYQRNPWRT